MATRSTIKFIENKKVIASIYKHFDGYISGVGYDIANWLKNKKIINGISGQTMKQGYVNGFDCLATQFIKDFKTEIGGIYMIPIDQKEEYNYKITYENGKFIIEVNAYDKEILFKGSPEELLEYKE